MNVGDYVANVARGDIVSFHKNDANKTTIAGYHSLGAYNYIKDIDGDFAYICAGIKYQCHQYSLVGRGAYLWKVRLENLRYLMPEDRRYLDREIQRLQELVRELILGRSK
jgi:hypothetical protein